MNRGDMSEVCYQTERQNSDVNSTGPYVILDCLDGNWVAVF